MAVLNLILALGWVAAGPLTTVCYGVDEGIGWFDPCVGFDWNCIFSFCFTHPNNLKLCVLALFHAVHQWLHP